MTTTTPKHPIQLSPDETDTLLEIERTFDDTLEQLGQLLRKRSELLKTFHQRLRPGNPSAINVNGQVWAIVCNKEYYYILRHRRKSKDQPTRRVRLKAPFGKQAVSVVTERPRRVIEVPRAIMVTPSRRALREKKRAARQNDDD